MSPSEWQSLTKTEREKLSRLGVRMSPAAVYFKALQSPPAMQMRRILWQAHNNRRLPEIDLDRPSALAGNLNKIDWACLGFRKIGNRAVRFESLERLSAWHDSDQQGTFKRRWR